MKKRKSNIFIFLTIMIIVGFILSPPKVKKPGVAEKPITPAPKPKAACQPGDLCYTVADNASCITKESLYEVYQAADQGETQLVHRLIDAGVCMVIKGGIAVYYVDADYVGTMLFVKVRVKNSYATMWVRPKALALKKRGV